MNESLFYKLAVGLGSQVAALAISLSQVNEFLQMVSLVIAIVIGAPAAFKLVRGWLRK